MRFTSAFLAASTFIGALARPEFTNAEFGTLTAGKPFELEWDNNVGAVTITLKKGDSGNLQTVFTVGSGLTGTSFSWTPSVSLADGTYALEIDDSTNVPNFSPQFQLTGGAGVTGTVATASGSTSSGASTASSPASTASTASSASSSAESSSASLPPLTTTTTTVSTSTHSVKTTSKATLTSSAKPSVQNTTTSVTVSSTGSSAGSSAASSTSSTRSSSSTTTSPPDNNSAAGLASPLAFVFLAFAAILTLN